MSEENGNWSETGGIWQDGDWYEGGEGYSEEWRGKGYSEEWWDLDTDNYAEVGDWSENKNSDPEWKNDEDWRD